MVVLVRIAGNVLAVDCATLRMRKVATFTTQPPAQDAALALLRRQ